MARVFALLLAVVAALSMSVCAFAKETQPYNADTTKIRAYINAYPETQWFIGRYNNATFHFSQTERRTLKIHL